MNQLLTIRDILKRPYFRDVTVYASEKALNRIVEWVHVLEVDDVGDLLNGNELLLTTGLTWRRDKAKGVDFLNQIICRQASGLVVEMGRVIHQMPAQMIQRAESADFALILVHSDIRYIDVTRDIHTLIINRQKQIMEELESFSNSLNRLLLRGEGINKLLQLFFTYTGKAVAYLPLHGNPIYVPNAANFDDPSLTIEGHKKASCPIVIMNQRCGSVIVPHDQLPDSFTSLAIDRLAVAVGQEIMRLMYWQEQQLNQEGQWLLNWFEDQLDDKKVTDQLWHVFPNMIFNQCAVAVFEPSGDIFSEEDVPEPMHRKIALRTSFRNVSIIVLTLNLENRLISVLLDLKENRSTTAFQTAIGSALQQFSVSLTKKSSLMKGLWGVSRIGAVTCRMKKQVTEALTVIDVQKHRVDLKSPFYSELHIYQTLHQMEKSGCLKSFIIEQIGCLLNPPNEKSIDYLETLTMYLNCGSVKIEAAAKLFISRQSLYKRLERLKELLGADFEEPYRKLAIELALLGYQYLHGRQTDL